MSNERKAKAEFIGAHLLNYVLVCDKCNTAMRPRELRDVWSNYKGENQIEETMTLLSYDSPYGHNHDDNCLRRIYVCDGCGHTQKVSKRRKCPTCDWIGKDSCGCHDGPKLDDWPK